MKDDSSSAEGIDWDLARLAMALHQFENRYSAEIRTAVAGELLSFEDTETTSKIRAKIAEICDRDRLAIPQQCLEGLVSNFIAALTPEA